MQNKHDHQNHYTYKIKNLEKNGTPCFDSLSSCPTGAGRGRPVKIMIEIIFIKNMINIMVKTIILPRAI